MDEDFRFRASMRTEEELRSRIDNREKYLPETVEASVEELKSRGIVFSGEELTVIAEDMQARRNIVAETSSTGAFNRNDINLHIEDPDAPEYYSKKIVVVFSIFFSALFGSVLLAVNISKTQKPVRAVWVVLFGLVFTIATGIAAPYAHSNTALAFLSGYAGGYLMVILFWNNFIGAKALYRPKPFWIPLIIGLVITGILLYLIVTYGKL